MERTDRVVGTCPKCGGWIDDEIVTGPLANFDINLDEGVDIETASLINGTIIYCENCESDLMIDAEVPVDLIKVKILDIHE